MAQDAPQILIRGGTVVDGTGAPAYRADVRLNAGRIVEVAADLVAEAGERVVDAEGGGGNTAFDVIFAENRHARLVSVRAVARRIPQELQ